jgi:CDP-6-deoxy-D-xylo-4-hexulose-3-dehydrase
MKVTDLQAAIGVAQLKKIGLFVEKRRHNFRYIYERLKEFEYVFDLPVALKKSNPSWFAFPLTVREDASFRRNEIVSFLEEKKIMTRPIFAGNLIKHPAYLGIEKRIGSELSITDKIMNNSFFIGVYPGISEEMLDYVGDKFEEFLRGHK